MCFFSVFQVRLTMTLPFLGIIGLVVVFLILLIIFILFLCAYTRPAFKKRIKDYIEEYRHPKKKKYRRRHRKYTHISKSSTRNITYSTDGEVPQNTTYPQHRQLEVITHSYLPAHSDTLSSNTPSQVDSEVNLIPQKKPKKENPRKSVVFTDLVDEIDAEHGTITRVDKKFSKELTGSQELITTYTQQTVTIDIGVHVHDYAGPPKDPPVLTMSVDGIHAKQVKKQSKNYR